MNNHIYDIIIVGGGPAGLTAGLYASRARLNTLLLEKIALGGQVTKSERIENYPGFKSIKGIELGMKFIEHAKEFGAEIKQESVLKINANKIIEIETEQGNKYKGKYLILAFGMQRRKLNVPGEEKLTGKGVSYCATCDGFFFKDKITAVVGGGNSAVMAAIELTQHAKEVHMFVKENEFIAEPIWVDRIKKNEKIK